MQRTKKKNNSCRKLRKASITNSNNKKNKMNKKRKKRKKGENQIRKIKIYLKKRRLINQRRRKPIYNNSHLISII